MRAGIVVVVAFVVGCASWPPPTDRASIVRATGDPAALERMLSGSVVNGGLWFHDPACAAQFGTPEEIRPDRFAAFARCVAGLHLQATSRVDELPDVLVLTYAPGFEVEARVIIERSGPRLTWIGYEARTSADPLIPTITVAALEQHRVAGERTGPIDPELAKTFAPSSAWLRICVDAEGAMAIQTREATSLDALHAFTEAAKAWKFRPFLVGDRAIPVCAMVRLAYPPERRAVTERLPLAIPPSLGDDPVVTVSPIWMEGRRIAGTALISPDDDSRTAIQRSGVTRIVGAFKLCVDATGHVSSVTPIHLTGVAAYDRKIITSLRAWMYRPILFDGKPTPVCTAVTFIYSQH